MIIPSIDLMGGKAVQLRQGKEKVLEVEDVFGLAARFSRYGDLAVIDLDAALGRGDNAELVEQLCRRFPCRVGGGVRTVERAISLIKQGARKVIVGTQATPDFLKKLPRDSLMAALDMRGDDLVTHGWTQTSGRKATEAARELSPFCSGFLCTIVDREGMLGGTDLERLKAVQAASSVPITAAGGITSVGEVQALDKLGMSAQLGMAIYTGALDLTELFLALVDFDKCAGLVPTIVRDQYGRDAMLAYSSPESLRSALNDGKGVYYSRSRKALWEKGATSGHTQLLRRAELDCDRDTLRFTVEQQGHACHLPQTTCFGDADKPFLDELYETLQGRIRSGGEASYTAQLASNPTLLREKIREEADEVCTAEGHQHLRWEVADLLYHVTVLMAKEGLTFAEVASELSARRR